MTKADGSTVVKNYSPRCRQVEIIPAPAAPEQMPIEVICRGGDPTFQQALLTVFSDVAVSAACRGLDPKSRECLHVRQHLQNCPSCSEHHQEDLWFMYEHVRDCFSVRNAAYSCRERLLHVMSNPLLEKISRNPASDADHAELFISEHPGAYVSDGQTILHFDGRWQEVSDQRMRTVVREWQRPVLSHLNDLVQLEIGILKQQRRQQPELLKNYCNSWQKMEKYLADTNRAKQLVLTIKDYLLDEKLWETMDSADHLLGTETGIVDLRQGIHRPAQREDMVSRSIGYAWQDAVDPSIEAEVEEFFEQIYPVQEERHMAVLFGGYALTGTHPEKKVGC